MVVTHVMIRRTKGLPGFLRTAGLLGLLTLALSACSESGERGGLGTPDDPDSRKILRVAYTREIDVLNALTSQNLVDIQFSMVEGLVTTDENNTYIPVLAKQIPTEENGLIVVHDDGTVTMTWPLQEGVRWHDGEAFTSDDVCFTWRFVSSAGSQVYNRNQYLGIVACETPDEHTVEFTWTSVLGYYAGLFEANLEGQMLFTNKQIVNAIKNNTTVTFAAILRNDDGAFVIDIPEMSMGGGAREFPVDQSVLVNITGASFTSSLYGFDVGISFFAAVPGVVTDS